MKVDHGLTTKRLVIGHVVMCRGCCCGDVNKGKPDVPVDWLKSEWRRRGLLKNIQLTISGCLGPCDLSNVMNISSGDHSVWLGNIRSTSQYEAILEWASQSLDAGALLPLPSEFDEHEFYPFHTTDRALTAELSAGAML
jgi:cobaltochelatase CobN